MPTTTEIYDPELYVDGPPHEVFAELRRTSPVHWQEMPGEPGYWAVLKHADVVHVAREPQLFSASDGGVVLENLEPAQLEMMRNMLLAMDPPRHNDYRRPLADSFKPRVIGQLEERVRGICRKILDETAAKGEVDFVHEVCGPLPTQVIGQLVGLPRQDWDTIHDMAERITHGQDPDSAVTGDEAGSAALDMAMYAIEFAAARRKEAPREDLASLLLMSEFGGEQMSEADFASFFVQLVTAGNDTTVTMLAGGLLALLQHPEQLAEVRADRTLVPGAVEEILRWANPLHYFRRTATVDTEIGRVQIKAGDKVAMYYTSANRDEDVFDAPGRFDIRRDPNPHLSFGIGQHFCLGVHLARLEGKVFFEELLGTFPKLELVGEPKRVRSNLNNALKHLPIKLVS